MAFFTRPLLVILFFVSSFVYSQSQIKTPHLEATIISSHSTVVPGQKFYVGILFKIIPEWHIYWKNAGDSGEAPIYKWQIPKEVKNGEIIWPAPKRIPLSILANYGYEHEVLLASPFDLAPSFSLKKIKLQLQADWLVCNEECIPETGKFEIDLPVANQPIENRLQSTVFDNNFAAAPRLVNIDASYEASTTAGVWLQIPVASLPLTRENYSFQLFPVNQGVFEAGRIFEENHSATHLKYLLKTTDQTLTIPETLSFVLAAKSKNTEPSLFFEFAAKRAASPGNVINFWWAIIGAFFGGLLLNLMPCVLPVLSLKAFSIINSVKENSKSLKREGVAYAVGILVSFWILAGVLLLLRAGGEALGWGFQLQNPIFVVAMFWLFILLALNFFGVFDFGDTLQAWSGRQLPKTSSPKSSSIVGAFMSGVLATLIATPCTAPFMGSAVGLALTLPPIQSLFIFTSLAIGMALPVLVIYLFPSILKIFPKPGVWMETLKQFMGFPMLATAFWLLWVYGIQTGTDSMTRALFAALALSILLWVVGRAMSLQKKVVFVLAGLIGFFTIAWPLINNSINSLPGSQLSTKNDYYGIEHEVYTRDRLRSALDIDKRPVYVDFTAAWCLSCQVNKRIVFANEEVQKLFRKRNILILKADWTDKNPTLLKELESFGRSGVPLNLYYDPSRPTEAHIFESLLIPSVVLNAIQQRSP